MSFLVEAKNFLKWSVNLHYGKMVKTRKEQYLLVAIFTDAVQFLQGELYKFKSLRGERTRWMLVVRNPVTISFSRFFFLNLSYRYSCWYV